MPSAGDEQEQVRITASLSHHLIEEVDKLRRVRNPFVHQRPLTDPDFSGPSFCSDRGTAAIAALEGCQGGSHPMDCTLMAKSAMMGLCVVVNYNREYVA